MRYISGLFFVFSLFIAQCGYAQIDGGAFNSTGSGFTVVSISDYQCLGVNPANLGWMKDGHANHLGFFDFGMSIYSEPLTKSMVFKDLIGNSDDFNSRAQRDAAISNFTNTDLLIRISNTSFGYSFQDENIGGFAVSVKQKVAWRSNLNNMASEFLFEGYNSSYFDTIIGYPNGDTVAISYNPTLASTAYNPTEISHILYNEYAFGYGRMVMDNDIVKLYAGIDFKLLQGYGIMNYNSISYAEVEGYQALSPFYGVKYDEPTPSEISGDGLRTAGMGFGLDLGVAAELYDKFRIAIALNDLGSINWDGNVYEGENVPVSSIETPGINNYNIFDESGGIIADNDHLGEWRGLVDKRISLPLHMRFGANYQAMDELAFGFEVLLPFEKDVPGAYLKEYYTAGVQYAPAPWFQLSAGMAYGGGYGFKIPIGFTFRPFNNDQTLWELGIASRDLTTWMKTEDPLVSFVFGFLRFGF